MDDTRRLRDSFDRIAPMSRSLREAELSRLDADQPILARELREMLAQHDTGELLLDRPLAAVGGVDRPDGWPSIAGLELVDHLGDGSSGSVFAAVRVSDGARIAVKVLHPVGASSKETRRFQREVEALRRVAHPYLARVHETGEIEAGGVSVAYLVMDLVEGVPLDVWCRESSDATRRARVQLLVEIAEGIHHAHLRGVVHRDLKPANILIDRDGHPRIIDFGIARSVIDEEVTHTLTGELVGTLAYMSPEQVSGDRAGIDARSDVHALGLVGYELITGRRARDVGMVPVAEALRRISEEELPPLPPVEDDPRNVLGKILRNAAATDPDERYASARDLAEDLGRFLRGESIASRSDHGLRRLRRTVRRYRFAVLVSLVVIGSLGVGAFLAWRGETRAREEAEQARHVAAILSDAILAVNPQPHGRAPTAKDVLGAMTARVEEATLSADLEDEVRSLLGTAYAHLGDAIDAEPHWARVVELRRSVHGDDHPETLKAMVSWVMEGLVHDVGRSREVLGEVLVGREFSVDSPLFLFDAELAMAELDRREILLSDASDRIERITTVAERRFGSADPRALACLRALGRIRADQGRLPDALAILETAKAAMESASSVDERRINDVEVLLVDVLITLGRLDEGLPRAKALVETNQRLHGTEHERTINARLNYARALQMAGESEEAIAMLREAVDLRERTLGLDSEATRFCQIELARALTMAREFADAEECILRIIERCPPGAPALMMPNLLLGNVYRNTERIDEAEGPIRRADEILVRFKGPDTPNRTTVLVELAAIQMALNDSAGAIETLEESIRVIGIQYPEGHAARDPFRLRLAHAYAAAARLDEARQIAKDLTTSSNEEIAANAKELVVSLATDVPDNIR